MLIVVVTFVVCSCHIAVYHILLNILSSLSIFSASTPTALSAYFECISYHIFPHAFVHSCTGKQHSSFPFGVHFQKQHLAPLCVFLTFWGGFDSLQTPTRLCPEHSQDIFRQVVVPFRITLFYHQLEINKSSKERLRFLLLTRRSRDVTCRQKLFQEEGRVLQEIATLMLNKPWFTIL